MNKNVFIVGFMLFAIFFGAGNLIFPPKLGAESGIDFWPAIIGFVITGVGLPLLGIVVSSFYTGGYKQALSQIHPLFSLAFLCAIYLALGPFFAGPRTAATAYEIAIVPFLNEPNAITQLVFCVIYFVITLWICLNPSKIVDRIGAILTPLLLISLIILIGRIFFLLKDTPHVIPATPIANPLSYGILEGYFTLDALASIAFAVLVMQSIMEKTADKSSITKQTFYAGIIAAVALAIIYIALGWVGNHLNLVTISQQNIGTNILNSATTLAFGDIGRIILGLIVTLACLTTAIGIISSAGEYFHEIYPRISYKTYVVIFILISIFVANMGLDSVIKTSVPVLLVLYPIAITVILLLLLNLKLPIPLWSFRMATALVTLESLVGIIFKNYLDEALKLIPLREYSMEWLVVMVLGLVLGYLIPIFKGSQHSYLKR